MDMTFAIQPSGAALGAEIHGLDLTRPLTEADAAALRQALLQHVLLVFPEQHLTAGQLADFCRCFGPITRHILDQFHHPEEHDLCIISNVVENGKGRTTARTAGSYWHSDLSYLAEPAETSMLYGIEVPETGGDTLFCNMYAAYDALPEAMRARVAGLTAVHNIMSGTGADAKVPLTEAQRAKVPDAIHPIVRRHPETGRDALFVNPGFTRRVVELDAAAGGALLEQLFAHATQARFTYRHKWHAGDVTLFDGRASMHSATGGYTNADRRTLWRAFMGGRYAA
ncbi:MAG: TauD/TfdA family dioxygenase [Proteobacteria bacterium]|nr:TauD/TfdA family dioxygenase [Pseudomonadota bacterium]MDA1355192.1 TauD/TfdA family dioxygenase [Pseudomonadota bacterium]